MKQHIVYILCLVFTLTLFGCNGGEKAEPAGKDSTHADKEYGSTITLALLGDADRLEPMLSSDNASHEVSGMIFNGLVKYDKDIILTGDLAESWDISDDNLTIVFHLRKDVKWQDGEPFTTADVLHTYNALIDPKLASPYSAEMGPVDEVTAVDDYTLKVTYKEPYVLALESWGMGMMPKHLNACYDEAFGRNPIGTGPYRFKEWKSGERIILEANDDYFKGRPNIDRVVFKIIPDRTTQFLELKTGGLDYMELNPVQYSRQTNSKEFNRKFWKYRYPDYQYTYMGFNLTDGRFQDKRVRQAIAYAIDKESIIEGALLGLGEVCTGPLPPKSWAYNPNVKPYGYEPDRAKRMLAEAGWKDTDGDGILDKNGQPFKFTIVTNQGNEKRLKAAQIIQQNLKAVGIDVNLLVLEWQSFINEYVEKGKFEAIILGWALTFDPDSYSIWHSSMAKEGMLNHVRYKNPEVDRLLEEGRRTFDLEKRKKIYWKFHEVVADDAPYVFLYVPDKLTVLDRRFKNVTVEPIGIWHNFEEWYVPEDSSTWYQ